MTHITAKSKSYETHTEGVSKKLRTSDDVVSEMACFVDATSGKQFRSKIAASVANSIKTGSVVPADLIECLEALHAFTLIHDDIIDKSVERRGQPSLWRKYTTELALLYGDYQHARVFEWLANSTQIPEHLRVSLISAFAEASTKVQEGQIQESAAAYDTNLSKEAYCAIAADKTSSLIWLACFIGGAIADADSRQMEHLREFARNFGIAFQIYNDLIDFESHHGKSPLDDLKSGKVTLPMIFYCQERFAYEEELTQAEYRQMAATGVLGRLAEEIQSSGALAKAHTCMTSFIDRAESAFEEITHIPPEIESILRTFRSARPRK